MAEAKKKDNNDLWIIVIGIIALFIISLATTAFGTIDAGDYGGVAKFFAGEYNTKIRSSHSYFYGLFHSPLLLLTKSLVSLKAINLIYLSLLIISVYYASGKNRRTLLLFMLSPVIWYLGPWINPIQLASLLFFWGYYFLKKWDETGKSTLLLVSGLLIGLSWAFWDAILYFSIIIAFSFLYNKKLYNFIFFFIFIAIGLSPKLISDQLMFNSAIIGIVRYFFSTIATLVWHGIYGGLKFYSYSLLNIISVIILIPFFSYKLISKKNWKENKKSIIFLAFSILLILFNSQIRYLLIIMPILILNLQTELTESQFKKQLWMCAILSLIVIIPYAIQINHSTNAREFSELIINAKGLSIGPEMNRPLLVDLNALAKEFPKETFIVGNDPDSYITPALLYWGNDVKEWVSIQDYELYLKNQAVLFSKTYAPQPNIADRRVVWIAGGISKNQVDDTDYAAIKYAITTQPNIPLDNFIFKKRYDLLYLYEKKA